MRLVVALALVMALAIGCDDHTTTAPTSVPESTAHLARSNPKRAVDVRGLWLVPGQAFTITLRPDGDVALAASTFHLEVCARDGSRCRPFRAGHTTVPMRSPDANVELDVRARGDLPVRVAHLGIAYRGTDRAFTVTLPAVPRGPTAEIVVTPTRSSTVTVTSAAPVTLTQGPYVLAPRAQGRFGPVVRGGPVIVTVDASRGTVERPALRLEWS